MKPPRIHGFDLGNLFWVRSRIPGMTQRELAHLAKVRIETVRALEQGKRRANWTTLYKFAEVLQVLPEALIQEKA